MSKAVLMISPFFSPNIGGVETHLDDLCSVLTQENIKTYVITYQPLTSRAKGEAIEKRGSVTIMRLRWYGYNLFHKLEKNAFLVVAYLFPGIFFKTLFFMIKHSKEIDVIHSHGILASFVATILKPLFKKRIIASTHAIYNFNRNSLFARVVRVVLGSFDKVLAISEQSKKELVNLGISEDKIVVYTYWVNQQTFNVLNKGDCKRKLNWQDRFVVLFVGRLLEIKGIKLLLESSFSLIDSISIAIIGDGPLAGEIRAKAKENKRIIFVGKVINKELSIYYNGADVVIVPSIYEEGYGRIILESLSCATPVIASKRGGITEALTSQVGILIDPSAKNIADTINNIYRDEKLRQTLSSRAREYALDNFSKKNAEVIIESYQLT